MINENIGAYELYLAPEEMGNLETITLSDNNESKTPQEIFSDNISRKSKKPERLEEIIEKRGHNLKVFRINDGTEQAVFFSSPIHVFDDESHTFEKIENTITEDDDGKHFTGSKNNFVAKFSREDNNDDIFSIEKGMHKVTVCARKTKKNINKGIKPILRRIYNEDADASDILTFSEIEANTDYEYSTESDGVKENIIVKKNSEIYRYPFLLKCENVSIKFDENENRIAFLSNESGEEVFFIPAPFMTDANGITSTNVYYDLRELGNGTAAMAMIADREFISSEDRAFPVVIDPQIKLSGTSGMTTYSWSNGLMTSSSTHTVGTTGSGDGSCNAKRMYIKLNLPTLPNNPRIKKAELVFTQNSKSTSNSDSCKFGLYRVTEDICKGFCEPIDDSNLIDYADISEKTVGTIQYSFDITSLVDQAVNNEISKHNLVMKMLDETCTSQNAVTLYGSSYSNNIYKPELTITYESSYGVNTSYRTHTHELGRFGQGSVDLQCGNLMFESEDFAWSGNKMPVTIKHLFNSALAGERYINNPAIDLMCADFSGMNIGHGFKLNVMQSMIPYEPNSTEEKKYIYIGENGEQIYFKKSDKTVKCESNSQCYNLYEDENSGDMLYDPEKRTLKQGEDTYLFDEKGRLIKITDASGNHMDITYSANRITYVTDGAGRDFGFTYNQYGQLVTIVAPDFTTINYSYANNLLTEITYHDNRKVEISYENNRPTRVSLIDENGKTVYEVVYTYNSDRISSVTEYGANGSIGAQSHYSYSIASARTVVRTIEQSDDGDSKTTEIKTIYTFDNDGNVISSYAYTDEAGNLNVQENTQGIHPYSGDGGMTYIGTSRNFIRKRRGYVVDPWGYIGDRGNVHSYRTPSEAKFGDEVFEFYSSKDDCCCENGLTQRISSLPPGEYTFSAYVKIKTDFTEVENAGIFLQVLDDDANVLAKSEILSQADDTHTRLVTSFTLNRIRSVTVQIVSNGAGRAFVEAPQLEDNPFASPYNHIDGGDFEFDYNNNMWNLSESAVSSSDSFDGVNALRIVGDPNSQKSALSSILNIKTSASTRETYTISGWAKAYALPSRENDEKSPTFRLRAVIYYTDNFTNRAENSHLPKTTEAFADFNPRTDDWQYVSFQIAKEIRAPIQYIRVYCDYDYNIGNAYFDDIQAVRSSIETNLTDEDFSLSATPTVTADEDETVTESANEAPTFTEVKDAYGNTLTETTFTDGEFGTIYRSFEFTPNCNCVENAGNDLIAETDARGNKTHYTVDEDTSRNEEVIDRLGNKTAYEYDASGRTTKVTSKNAEGTELAHVSYSYDAFDNMTEIVRGDGMKFALAYNEFHNLESIGIDGKTEKLIQYTYKNGNGRLKEMTYANGDTMKATYNSIGQMVSEKWFDSTENLTAHYKYSYDGEGNIIRSIDILANKEYNYEYEEGRIVRATEANITLSGEVITYRGIINTVRYYYDNDGKMTKKVITFVNGSKHTVYYENNDDSAVVKFTVGGKTVTSHSKTDSFGRKTFDELQLGTGFVSREFSYCTGAVTQEHIDAEKFKSSPTTQLVSQIILSNETTLSYGYDDEERITSVSEKYIKDGIETTHTVNYTYDALGQLLTETSIVQTIDNSQEKPIIETSTELVNSMEYDNYGNITKKNGKAYTYGNAMWKDLLTGFDGKTIEYDAQGNPTSYLGHTLTWEKGRQLKSYDTNTYTYNANGIRTSKTVNGVTHEYTLDGTKILREVWGNNTLIPLYDNEDSVCGIIYNDVPYYFIKNLQDDVIEIITSIDNELVTVAKYSYDAWGVCTVTKDSVGIATINPFRYRSYYYDEDIGLYYLQSRYYDASVGRFINEDSVSYINVNVSILVCNLFAYSLNTPINRSDENGCFSTSEFWQYVNSLPIIKGVTHFAGFAWDRHQGIWYSLMNPKQRNFGYCDLYDTLAPLAGIFISHKKMPFYYDGKNWMIWLWKGQYGITIGAEIGIYVYTKGHWIEKTTGKNFYRCATDDERIKMSFTLYKNGKKMFKRGYQTHWWLTGFKPGIKWWWENLSMHITLGFKNLNMAKSFCSANGLRTPLSQEVSFWW